MASKTANWTAAYEAIPADANNVANGAGRIRDMKTDVRERIAEDHYMDIAGNQTDHGQHKQVTFRAPLGAAPTFVANKSTLYTLTANKCELWHLDGANNNVQLTKANAVMAFPANTVMAFGQNSPPTGWTRLTTGDTIYDAATDNAMFCFAKTGNVAQGGSLNPQNMAHYHGLSTGNVTIPYSGWTGGYTANGRLGYSTGTENADSGLTANRVLSLAGNSANANVTPYYVELILAKKD